MQCFYVGIDPGLNGGIAVISKMGNMEYCSAMPVLGTGKKTYDLRYIKQVLEKYRTYGNINVMIERQQPMRKLGVKQGVVATFTTGVGFGQLVGLCCGLGLQYGLVPAQRWQKSMLDGFSGKLGTKDRSKMAASARWPDFDFVKSTRARKCHDGMCDAALIAEYSRLREEIPKG